uniref:MIF4G domain-containing protein n=1 Tax=Meloidogyne hapla TaxID=6305 RepID=A0A1I8BAC3_MELHA
MVICSLEQMITGRYTNVPQASIMKIVELDEQVEDEQELDEQIKKLRMIFSNVTTHLNKRGRKGYFLY